MSVADFLSTLDSYSRDEQETRIETAKQKYGIKKLFKALPPKFRTYTLFLEAINEDEDAFKLLEKEEDRVGLKPGEYKELCLKAISRYGISIFTSIKPAMRSYDICLTAIEKDHYALAYLLKEEDRIGLQPGEYNRLIERAIEIHGTSLLYSILPFMRNYELCLAAIDNEIIGLTLVTNPIETPLLTPDQYSAIISHAKKKYGISETFRYLNPKMRTYKECLEAVEHDGNLLLQLAYPEEREGLKSDEFSMLCLKAFKDHGFSILAGIPNLSDCIPTSMWTYDFCVAAITANISWLEEIQRYQTELTLSPDEVTNIYLEAINIHGIEDAFPYLPAKMRTYDICYTAALNNVAVLSFLMKDIDRNILTPKEYIELCLAILSKQSLNNYTDIIDLSSTNTELVSFIKHYESVNKSKEYEMDDIGTFFTLNDSVIASLYSLLGNNCFSLMKYMIATSDDNLNRFFSGFTELDEEMLASTSKNISRLIANINHTNASQKAAELKLYLFLSPEEKVKINFLLDNKDISIKTIVEEMRKIIIKKMHDYSGILYNNNSNVANVMDELSSEELTDLNSLFEYLKPLNNYNDQSKMFFCLLKMYLGRIPFEYLHEPDEMKKTGDSYLVKMAEHNKKLREELDAKGINTKEAFSYNKELPIEFDEYQKQKILYLLHTIYEKLKSYTGNNRNIKNLISQIEKGKADFDTKLFRIISGTNFKTLTDIVNSGAIGVTNEYSELKIKLGVIDDVVPMSSLPYNDDVNAKSGIIYLSESGTYTFRDTRGNVQIGEINTSLIDLSDLETKLSDPALKSRIVEEITKQGHLISLTSQKLIDYQPRRFHIEMWDKSKIKTFFLGDYLSCCLATTGIRKSDYAPRIFDDAFLFPVIIDEIKKQPVSAAWLFFANATKPPEKDQVVDLVANYLEINAGVSENKELTNFLVANLLNYIDQFSKDVNAAEFIMRPLTYGMISDFRNFGSFSATNFRNIEKTGGYLGKDKYYLDAVDINKFYVFDKSYFDQEMRDHIVTPKPKEMQNYAKMMTLGFASTKPNSSSKSGFTDKEPNSMAQNKK